MSIPTAFLSSPQSFKDLREIRMKIEHVTSRFTYRAMHLYYIHLHYRYSVVNSDACCCRRVPGGDATRRPGAPEDHAHVLFDIFCVYALTRISRSSAGAYKKIKNKTFKNLTKRRADSEQTDLVARVFLPITSANGRRWSAFRLFVSLLTIII